MGFHPPLLCAPPNVISPLVQHYPRDKQRDRERGQDPSVGGIFFISWYKEITKPDYFNYENPRKFSSFSFTLIIYGR